MYTIDVTRTLPATREATFDAVSDHETLLSRGRAVCCVVRAGTSERNGMGALREIRNGPMVFREEIIAFDRPSSYTYVIRTLRGPLGLRWPVRHDRGWLELSETPSGTMVRWRSIFSVPLPLIGPWLERWIGRTFAAVFTDILKGVGRDLAQASDG